MSSDVHPARSLARVLQVLESQLMDSMQQAAGEWSNAVAAFDRLSAAHARLGSLSGHMPVSIEALTREIGDSLGSAAIALQHHDRLAQRLGHIRVGICQLRDLLSRETESPEWLLRLRQVEQMQHEAHAHLITRDPVPHGSVELF